MFEWDEFEVTDHSTEAVLANQFTANFFVAEARKSNHRFRSRDVEMRSLIYNYNPVYSYAKEPDFEQCYFFNRTRTSHP